MRRQLQVAPAEEPALVHLGHRRRRHHRRRPARLRQRHASAQAQGPRRAARRQDRRASFATTFEDANNYMKNGTLMRQVINKINGIDFNASDDRHMFGDIYEKLLKDLQSRRQRGRVLHAPRRHPVHRRAGESPARRDHPRPRLRHRAAFSSAPSSTCASRPRPRPTSAPSRTASRASRKSTCRTSSA